VTRHTLNLPDDFFDVILDQRECRQYVASVNPWVSVLELYTSSHLRLHIHLDVFVKDQFRDYCATFAYHPIADRIVRKEAALNIGPGSKTHDCTWPESVITPNLAWSNNCDIRYLGDRTDNVNQAVFIGVVDVAQECEWISERFVGSVVRLQRLDDCEILRRDSGEAPLFRPGVLVRFIDDRKHQILSPAVRDGERANCIDHQIKCRPGIMREVSNGKPPLRSRGGLDIDRYQLASSRVGVVLNDQNVGIRLDESPDCAFQHIEMMLCPATLQSNPSEIIHGKESKDTTDTQGRGNPDSKTEGHISGLEEGSQSETKITSQGPPEEEADRTSTSHHSGDCTAKHTRLDRTEDA